MYSRFTSLEKYGRKELERLQKSRVAVVGLGSTGSVIADHLARHGVELILIDRDYLEKNDLYSSSIYTPQDVEEGLPKAVAAEKKLSKLTATESHVASLHARNVSLLDGVDLLMDGTDNLETRFLLNEYSKKNGVPWIYTAAIAERGYSMLFDTECFSCVFQDVNAGSLETCETAGIMREVSSGAASKSALKAVSYLCGKETTEELEILPSGERLAVESGGCRVCNSGEFRHLESGTETPSVCGENKYQLEREIDENARERLKDIGEVITDNQYLTRVKTEVGDFTLFSSGRAIIEARDHGHAEQRFTELLG